MLGNLAKNEFEENSTLICNGILSNLCNTKISDLDKLYLIENNPTELVPGYDFHKKGIGLY